MDRSKLLKLLEQHDHSYEYSDDREVYYRGSLQETAITKLATELKCPFVYKNLVDYITEQAIHFYKLDSETGRYYKEEWKTNWKMYQPSYNELMSEELYNQIDNWFKLKE